MMEQVEYCDDMVARGERWAPLGAAEPENDSNCDYDDEEYWTGYE